MKLLKYLSIAAIALMSVACSDDDDNPTIKSPGVYFGEDNTAETMLSPVEGAPTSFEVSVWRTENKGQQTVDITYTADDANVFTVPATASFADGAYKTTFTVDCNMTGWEIGKSREITFNLGGDYISDYAYAGEFTKKVTLFYTFKKLGKSFMQDNWITVLFTDIDWPIPPYEVEIEEAEQLPGYYRIVNPYGASFCATASEFTGSNFKPAYDGAKDPKYIYIHAEDDRYIWIERQPATGNPWFTRFAQEVGDYIGFQVAKGATIEECKAAYAGAFMYKESNGSIWFQAGCARFGYYNNGTLSDNNGNGWANVGEASMLITAPGAAFEDFNASLEYVGVLAVDKKGSELMIKQTYGSDVKYAKYALVSGAPEDMDPVYNDIIDGKIESKWIEDIAAPYIFVPVSEGGKFTVAVVTYGHDNEVPKGHGYVSFNAILGSGGPTEGMEEAGQVWFVDGWVITGYGYKDDSGNVVNYNAYDYRYVVPLWKSKTNNGQYGLLSPYGKDVFKNRDGEGQYVKVFGNTDGDATVMVKFDVSNPNLIKMPCQYSGFTNKDDGAKSIANLEGMLVDQNPDASDADIIGYMTEKGYAFTTYSNGVVTIPTPRWYNEKGQNGGKWYYWNDPQAGQIYMPGSTPQGIAATLSASRKNIAPAAFKMTKVERTSSKIFTGKVFVKDTPVR